MSFLFGAIAHSAADIPWHDLEITYEGYQGFIQSMADHDFFGNFGGAHSVADSTYSLIWSMFLIPTI